MNPIDRIANARAVVKLLLDMLCGVSGGLDLTEDGVVGLFVVLQAVSDELEAAIRDFEERGALGNAPLEDPRPQANPF